MAAARKDEREASLLGRWREIEAIENVADDSAEELFTCLKETWFIDAFSFLLELPKEEHCWCRYKDIVWPLLETFYHYFEDSGSRLSLQALWSRLSQEMDRCIQCVLQHHKAQEFYATEFVEEVVDCLLGIIQTLDEERVAIHIKDIMQRVKIKELDAEKDSEELVCILFEVLMYPSLLEDDEIYKAFIPFLQHVRTTHELSLAQNQVYPGVYALLFHSNQDARGIALQLAAIVGKLRVASDLGAIEPILQKCMHVLEFDAFSSKKSGSSKEFSLKASDVVTCKSRTRSSFTRESLWIGMKTLLGLAEPPVVEEIVERYPSFVSIVLNHVSEASSIFWNALHCLRLLLEVLGFKIWLKTTFSPGVMHNTLLGRCFHTREEKIHKAIFDLFQPFLKSLEALQDGEYETQRRILLYFLLQQVPHSSNFSGLMRKKARQISFLIVEWGYKMDPPCPPVECAHVWGPPLVKSVKDTSLYTSVRQPAIALMQTIIIADSFALAWIYSKSFHNLPFSCISESDEQDADDGLNAVKAAEVTENNCWKSFRALCKSITLGCVGWLCIPLLWIDVLGQVIPSCIPSSFSQAVLWALSRLSPVYQSCNANSAAISGLKYSSEIVAAFQWETPKGCDDGAGGKHCVNSVKAQLYCTELVGLFKRSADLYVARLCESGIVEQWLWDPVVAEVLILLFLDLNEVLRDFNRYILSHFAKDHHLDAGLKFLCSDEASAVSVSFGLYYAVKMFMASSLPESSQGIRSLCFIAWKIFNLHQRSSERGSNLQDALQLLPSSEDGGFLKQPNYTLESDFVEMNTRMEKKSVKMLCNRLASDLWPLLVKSLREGRQFVSDHAHLMTFARVFDLLPLVFRNVILLLGESRFNHAASKTTSYLQSSSEELDNKVWMQELFAWCDVEIMAIYRRWKVAVTSIIKDLGACTFHPDSEHVKEILKWLQSGPPLDANIRQKIIPIIDSLLTQALQQVEYSIHKVQFQFKAPEVTIQQGSVTCSKKCHDEQVAVEFEKQTDIIDLSDDDIEDVDSWETENIELACPDKRISDRMKGCEKSLQVVSPSDIEHVQTRNISTGSTLKENKDVVKVLKPSSAEQSATHKWPLRVRKVPSVVLDSGKNLTLDKYFGSMKHEPTNVADVVKGEEKGIYYPAEAGLGGSYLPEGEPFQVSRSLGSLSAFQVDSCADVDKFSSSQDLEQRKGQRRTQIEQLEKRVEQSASQLGDILIDLTAQDSADRFPAAACKETTEGILRELVANEIGEPLEDIPDVEKTEHVPIVKTVVHPKRQLMRLQLPGEQERSNFGRSHRLGARLVPPRLDEWYRLILCLNYFDLVGMASDCSTVIAPAEPLTKIPLTFESAEHYMGIFRPLVLEEFKAQLQHAHEDLFVSDAITTGMLRLMSLEKVDDFQFCRFISDAGADGVARACFENDLVLLSRKPFQLAFESVHAIGKVERRERDAKCKSVILVVRLFLHSASARLVKTRRLLVDRSKWHATRLISITPQLREFQALSSVENIPFLPVILNPLASCRDMGASKLQAMQGPLEGLPERLQLRLKSDYDESQLKAIDAVVGRIRPGNSHELLLVQGPPGTGKTRTIAAIVSALLARIRHVRSQLNRNVECLPFDKVHSSRVSCVSKKTVSQTAAVTQSWQAATLARECMKKTAMATSRDSWIEQTRRGRVLVCAQSNAAVDELVSRICKDGLYDVDGCSFKPYLVRVGNVKTVHPDSFPVFIDTLVEESIGCDKLGGCGKTEDNGNSCTELLRRKLEKVIEEIQVLETQHFQASATDQLNQLHPENVMKEGGRLHLEGMKVAVNEAGLKIKLNILYQQRRKLYAEVATAEAEERKTVEEGRTKRQSLKRDIIREAEVVVATLSGCGGDVYSACMESFCGKNQKKHCVDSFFDAVVIDEAAQALEPATLIPLQLLNATHSKCVMVGDPKQLPATVLSQLASRFSYECSMFERLQQGGYPVTMLGTQYRMHPEIRSFPSMHFYNNQLTDGSLMASGRFAAFHRDWCFGPYIFFDVVEGYEKSKCRSASQSLCNEEEVEVVYQIFINLRKRYPSEVFPGRVGIITPYKQQLSLLRERFIRSRGCNTIGEIEFNTVDGFQGREVDILILSTVRATSHKASNLQHRGIGFVADVRRMNVALTRARFSLWIVGNAATLRGNPSWIALLNNAKERGLMCTMKKPYETFFSASYSTGNSNVSLEGVCTGSKKECNADLKKDLKKVMNCKSDKVLITHNTKNCVPEEKPTRTDTSHCSPGEKIESKGNKLNTRKCDVDDSKFRSREMRSKEVRCKEEERQQRKSQASLLNKLTEGENDNSIVLGCKNRKVQEDKSPRNGDVQHDEVATASLSSRDNGQQHNRQKDQNRSRRYKIRTAACVNDKALPDPKHECQKQFPKADECKEKNHAIQSQEIGGNEIDSTSHVKNQKRQALIHGCYLNEGVVESATGSSGSIDKICFKWGNHKKRGQRRCRYRSISSVDKVMYSNAQSCSYTGNSLKENKKLSVDSYTVSTRQKNTSAEDNWQLNENIPTEPEQNIYQGTDILQKYSERENSDMSLTTDNSISCKEDNPAVGILSKEPVLELATASQEIRTPSSVSKSIHGSRIGGKIDYRRQCQSKPHHIHKRQWEEVTAMVSSGLFIPSKKPRYPMRPLEESFSSEGCQRFANGRNTARLLVSGSSKTGGQKTSEIVIPEQSSHSRDSCKQVDILHRSEKHPEFEHLGYEWEQFQKELAQSKASL